MIVSKVDEKEREIKLPKVVGNHPYATMDWNYHSCVHVQIIISDLHLDADNAPQPPQYCTCTFTLLMMHVFRAKVDGTSYK
jgi:hypothetical protein